MVNFGFLKEHTVLTVWKNCVNGYRCSSKQLMQYGEGICCCCLCKI